MSLKPRILALLMPTLFVTGLTPVSAQETDKKHVIQNDTLLVTFNQSTNRFTVEHRPSSKVFVTTGGLSKGLGKAGTPNDVGKAAVNTVTHKTFGDGQAID